MTGSIIHVAVPWSQSICDRCVAVYHCVNTHSLLIPAMACRGVFASSIFKTDQVMVHQKTSPLFVCSALD